MSKFSESWPRVDDNMPIWRFPVSKAKEIILSFDTECKLLIIVSSFQRKPCLGFKDLLFLFSLGSQYLVELNQLSRCRLLSGYCFLQYWIGAFKLSQMEESRFPKTRNLCSQCHLL